ncbi:MAG: HAD family hydrolase [Alphaproteobacteria bacterium]
MTDTAIRIGMWAGPRNISTTMMRSFGNRPDTAVADEPFYAYYLRKSGADHPMRDAILGALPQTFQGVVDMLNGPVPKGRSIYFHKHIAYHASAKEDLPLDWIDGQRTFILIRDPRAMVASYAQKHDDVGPILASLDVKARIMDHLAAKGLPCPIVDAADVLRAPEPTLRILCKALDIPFLEEMLSWPAGPCDGDGVWGDHWYDTVRQSTGFMPLKEEPVDLTPDLDALAQTCMERYRELHGQRLLAA